MSNLQIAAAVLIFVIVTGLVLGALTLARPSAARQRMKTLGMAEAGPPPGDRLAQWVAAVTQPFSRLSAPEEGFEKSSLKLRFVHAGIRSSTAPATFFGVKTLLTLGLPALAFVTITFGSMEVYGNSRLLLLLAAAAIGYYAPNIWLSRRVRNRQREILESFPDALDLMTVCVEAGLGTEAALMRVAEDMQVNCPVLSEEMRLVNLELRAGADREHALRNLAIRTGVDEIDGFVTMISQAERFGTSIAASLRIQADMLRTRRRQRAEETAAKISLKLLFPLMFCIFPSLMVVLMGPAVLQLIRVFATIGT